MNIFEVSHALMVIEEAARGQGLREDGVISFLMWLSDEKFPNHVFDGGFVATVVMKIQDLVKEYSGWVEKMFEQDLMAGVDL